MKKRKKPSSTTLIDYLNLIHQHLDHADKVYFNVNNLTKQCLRTYHSLGESDEKESDEGIVVPTNEPKPSIPKASSDNKKQPKSLGNTRRVPATKSKPVVKETVTSSKLDKILAMARSIRSREEKERNDPIIEREVVVLPQIVEKRETEVVVDHKVAKCEPVEVEKMSLQERVKQKLDHLQSLKKKKQKLVQSSNAAYQDYLRRLQHISAPTRSVVRVNTDDILKIQILLAVSAYIDVIDDHLNSIIDFDTLDWNILSDQDASTQTFLEIYSGFDKNVSQPLMSIDSESNITSYEDRCLSLMKDSVNPQENPENLSTFLSVWHSAGSSELFPNPTNYLSNLTEIQPAITVKDENEAIHLSNLRNEIQQLLLQEQLEDLFATYILPQLDTVEGLDKKRILRLLDSCLLNQGKTYKVNR